jgi:hypothetical protein
MYRRTQVNLTDVLDGIKLDRNFDASTSNQKIWQIIMKVLVGEWRPVNRLVAKSQSDLLMSILNSDRAPAS